jgi:heme exporter protein D
MSMEERPVLSSDLEKMAPQNPFAGSFYLKKKLLFHIVTGVMIWLFNARELRNSWKMDGNDLYQQVALFLLASYFIYSQVRLLLFADYSALLSLPLFSFLGKIENILDKYILSFRVISLVAGCSLLAILEKLLFRWNSGAYLSISQNGFYKWLIIIFLSVSFYILLLHSVMQKYKKSLAAVRSYKERIAASPQKL